MIKRFSITTLLLCLMLLSAQAQKAFRAKHEIVQIPKVKAYHVKGSIELNTNAILFTPEDHDNFKSIGISKDSIAFIDVYPSILTNRIVIYTSKEQYSFYSRKATQISEIIKEDLSGSLNFAAIDEHKVFLLKRVPFIFPIVLDYSFEGRLKLDVTERRLVFMPIVNQTSLQKIELDLDQIKKVKTSCFWLFPKNILKVKLNNRKKYKFASLQAKRIKLQIRDLM